MKEVSSRTVLTQAILPDLIRITRLAEMLAVRESTIRKWLNHGVIPGKKLGGIWVIPRMELMRALSFEGIARIEEAPRRPEPEPGPERSSGPPREAQEHRSPAAEDRKASSLPAEAPEALTTPSPKSNPGRQL